MARKRSVTVFQNVQVLRAVAAYMVVCHHLLNNLAHYTAVGLMPEPPAIGARGVEIFFVISGFIMVSTTDAREQSPGRFLAHRIVRIVPIYWLLTLVAACAIAAGFQLFNRGAFSLDTLFTSLLFMPAFQAGGEVTKPIVVVGWTLNYEMMFYTLFALCLFCPRSVRIWLACGGILALWGAQVTGTGGLIGYWGNDIVLSFVLGMLIARGGQSLTLDAFAASGAILFGALALVVLEVRLVPAGVAHPGMISALAAGAIVLGVVSFDRRGKHLPGRWLQGQGDASYSIYLLHPFILQIVGKLWLLLHLTERVGGVSTMVLVMVGLVCLCGTLFHHRIEKPVTERLRGWVDYRRESGTRIEAEGRGLENA
ncbi:acyltransferase [Novosphingobium sp. 1949]|uniref:Acyltransferase n=1 Tax=Novosphingobium organovorum TaxID=2930092 RepID=A0ABT0BAG9_9SPHN|nr:acyltransferase [Novosphingobium organovorum]MCJ2182023.1 acyltransferase [Novosphingobium organovorum]